MSRQSDLLLDLGAVKDRAIKLSIDELDDIAYIALLNQFPLYI